MSDGEFDNVCPDCGLDSGKYLSMTKALEHFIPECERLLADGKVLKQQLENLEKRHSDAVDAWNREIDRNKDLVSTRQDCRHGNDLGNCPKCDEYKGEGDLVSTQLNPQSDSEVSTISEDLVATQQTESDGKTDVADTRLNQCEHWWHSGETSISACPSCHDNWKT